MRLLLLVLLASPVFAADFYYASASAGSNNGTSCANAYAYTDATNGINTVGKWVADNNLHLCGTITGTGGSTIITGQASGTSGHPITIKFEPGSVLTAPYWNGAGAINLNSQTNVVIDGNSTGTITSTANGSSLANQQTARGITASGDTNGIVKNLTISNIYVHVSGSDIAPDQTNTNCIAFLATSNFLIDGVTCHDAGWGFNGSGSTIETKNSEIYNVDHCWAVGPAGSISGVLLHGNHCHDFANWDTGTNTYHHDGVHMFGLSGGCITSSQIYNNLFDGNPGTSVTGFIFLEECNQSVIVYNNVFVTPNTQTNVSIWFEGRSPNHGSTNAAYNNFVQAGAYTGGTGIFARFQDTLSVQNNVVLGSNTVIGILSSTLGTVDYNTYQDLGADGVSFNTFGWNGTNWTAIATWRTNCSCDAHAAMYTAANLKMNANGTPQSGAPAIGAGNNLSGLSITPLNSDAAGNARSAPWTTGAYNLQAALAISSSVQGVGLTKGGTIRK